MPPRREELRQLCELLLSCKDDAVASQLAQQLRSAIHAYVESVRSTLPSELPTPAAPEIPQTEKNEDAKDVA